jgi:hypothetical protein
MKSLLLTAAAFILAITISAQEINRVYKADSMVFFGLDYSGAVFLGSNGFNSAAELEMLPESWNSLFVSEQKKYDVQTAFNVRTRYNLNVVKERNKRVNYADRITDKEILIPHLTRKDVEAVISGYPDMDGDIGLVFIVDAYDKTETKGYYHVVFFDIQTKEVLLRYMVSGNASGAGLRNYWANTFYEAIKKAGKRYSTTAEFYRSYTK